MTQRIGILHQSVTSMRLEKLERVRSPPVNLSQWAAAAKSSSQTADKSGTRSATSRVIGFNQSHLQTAGSLRWEAHRLISVVPSVPPPSLPPRMGISGKL